MADGLGDLDWSPRLSISSAHCKVRKAGGVRGLKTGLSAASRCCASGFRRNSDASLILTNISRSLVATAGSHIVSSTVYARTSLSSMPMAAHAEDGVLYRKATSFRAM